MSVAVAGLRPARAVAERDAVWTIADHVFRSSLRWAAIWGVVFGVFVLATVKAYTVAFPTAADRIHAVASLRTFSIILGQPYHAETIAGFTSWRVTLIIALIGALWGLLTSTGLLRGDEDAGRWELMLAGPTTKLRAAAGALLGLGASLGVMLGITAAGTLVAGAQPGANFSTTGSILFALTLVSGAAMFLAVGALTSQLGATRAQAATLAASVMGISFVARMVADGVRGLDWLLWLTPFGWVEEARPLRDIQPIAFLPIAVLVAAAVAATVVLATARDLGASVLRENERPRDGSALLVGPTSLALRLVRATAIGWVLGLAGYAVFSGLVTRSASSLLADSPAFAATLGRLGVRQASEGYLGISFLFISVILGVLAAAQVASLREEEAAGRLDNLLVRPTPRLVWLGGRAGIALALVVGGGLTAGSAMWVGAASQHAGVPFEKVLEAGANAAVPGAFVIGVGVLAFGLAPRLTAAVSYGVVAYSFLVNLVGSLVRGQDWIRDSSVFSHIKLAPAVKPDWGEAAVVLLIAVVAAVIGAIAFQRRDIEYA